MQDFRGLRAVLRDSAPETVVPVFDEALYPLPTIEELKRAGWPKNREILARGILAVTLRAGASDIADDTPASRSHLAQREYHHLFPDALLTGVDYGRLSPQDSFRALNCALFWWNTNRNISAKEPVKYLRERTERGILGEPAVRHRTGTHLIPFDALDVGGYDKIADLSKRADRVRSDYEGFLDERARLLLQPIRALTNGENWP